MSILKQLIIAILLFLFFSIGSANAEGLDYWIDDDLNVYTQLDLSASSNTTLYTSVTGDNTPNIDILPYHENFESGVGTWTDDRTGSYYRFIIGSQYVYEGSKSLIFGRFYGSRSAGTGTFTETYANSNQEVKKVNLRIMFSNNAYHSYNWIRVYIGDEYHDVDTSTSLAYNWQDVEFEASEAGTLKIAYQVYVSSSLLNGASDVFIDDITTYSSDENQPTQTITQINDIYKIELQNNELFDLTDYLVKINGTQIGVTSTSDSLFFYEEMDGSGTIEDPYQIDNVNNLQIVQKDLTAHYILMNDINASVTSTWNGGKGFEPIGGNTLTTLNPGSTFTGSLNGNGHVIKDIYINRPNNYFISVFGSSSGHIYNLGIEDATITGKGYVAGCAASSTGLINETWTTGLISSETGYYTGGITAKAFNANFNNVYSQCDVTGGTYVGGIVAEAGDTQFDKCYFAGTLNGNVLGGIYATTSISYPNINVISSYYDKDKADIYLGSGVAKTTEEMQTQTTFISWDFEDTWIMYDYPFLRKFVSEIKLNVSVYDESTGDIILPDAVKLFNEDVLYAGIINETSNTTVFNIKTFENRLILSVMAEGYYTRNQVVNVLNIENNVNMYLIDVNKTVIFETFKIIDNSMLYNYNNMVIRLDKPLENGTQTVFSSYLDFAGTTSAYLIATDNYILFIETPEETINYGWLTPDADGQIDITLNGISIDSYYDDWCTYNYTASNGIVNLDYISKDDISHANFIITNSNTELYNVTSSTKSGSFNYVIQTNDTVNVYFELVRQDGATISDFWIVPGTEAEKTVFPESYPQWLKNAVVTAIAILCILGFSSYRIEVGLALGVGIISIAYLWGEYSINKNTGYTVFLMVFITIIEFILQQRKEARR